MALHPGFPTSPYTELLPEQRWFPAAEELRGTSYDKLVPPLVANIRTGVKNWRDSGYAGASTTSRALLRWWFDTEHLIEHADGTLAPFRYYFAQREAVETVVWLHDVRNVRDKFDLMRFDASGAISAGMFAEAWPRYVLKLATGAGKTKVLSLLIAWSHFYKLYEPDSSLARNLLLIAPNIIVLDSRNGATTRPPRVSPRADGLIGSSTLDEEGFTKSRPATFESLVAGFTRYQALTSTRRRVGTVSGL
jgi:type III restriction enzyme